MLAGQTDVGGTIGAAELLGAVIDTELTRSERIATPGDIDMYAFDASRGDIVRIETRLPAGGATCDTYLRIFDASGEQILVDDDRNTQSPNYSRIDGFVAPANGRYFVGVSSSANGSYRALDGTGSQDGLSTGDYTLAMTRTGRRVGETGTNDRTTAEQTTKTGFDQFGPITVSIIRLTYSYAGAVTVAGTPVWQLAIGSDVVAATFTEQSGDGRTLTFEYTIANGVAGTVNPAAQLSLPTGASITDTTNAPAALNVATKPSIPDVVDDTSPRAASVSYPDAALYKRGDRLDFTVTFDEAVRVTGVPSLQLTVGAQQRTADFRFVMGGKKANKAVFSYVADVTDSDGIELEQGPIHARSQLFASAAIRLGDATIKDRANNIAGLSPYREADDFPPDVRRIAIDAAAGGSVRIDADAPAAPSAPTEQGSTKLADGKLNAAEITGDTLFRVGLGTSGARVGDTVELLIGGTAFSTPQTVTLVSGDVTNGFVDFHLTGAELGADGAKSLSARVTDEAGNVGSAGEPLAFLRDTVAPSVVITSDRTTLSSGQTTLVTFDFSEPPATFGLQSVDVQGGTLSPLTAESASRYTAVFTPTSALGSVAVKESQLTDAAGNPNRRSNTVAIAYDNGGPKANAVILPRPGVYGANKRLVFSVVFHVPVKVSAGAQPALAVQVGGNSRLAIWDARAGARSFTTRLSFALTTTPGDSAPGGIVIDSSMINGDSIRDKQGRSSVAGLPAVNATVVVVDAVRPAIVGLGAVPAGPFLKGQTVQLTVTFNKPVTPVGPTAVRFTIPGFGAGTFGRPSGTGTTTLTFSYRFIKPTSGTVQIASLLTGSVRDTAGNLVRNPVIPNA